MELQCRLVTIISQAVVYELRRGAGRSATKFQVAIGQSEKRREKNPQDSPSEERNQIFTSLWAPETRCTPLNAKRSTGYRWARKPSNLTISFEGACEVGYKATKIMTYRQNRERRDSTIGHSAYEVPLGVQPRQRENWALARENIQELTRAHLPHTNSAVQSP